MCDSCDFLLRTHFPDAINVELLYFPQFAWCEMIVEWWDAMRPTPFQKFPPLPTVPFIYIFYFGEMRKLGHRKLIYSSLWLIRFAASAISRKFLSRFLNLLSCSRKASPRTHFMTAPLLAFINIHKYEQSGAGKDIWFRFWLPRSAPSNVLFAIHL